MPPERTQSSLPPKRPYTPKLYAPARVEEPQNRPPARHDGPGVSYILTVEHKDGTVELKAGRSNNEERRLKEWRAQCFRDKIELVFSVPTQHAKKLERIVHGKFKSLGTWITPYKCRSCGVFHREKFTFEFKGGLEEAKKLMVELAAEMAARGE
ncbi:hypothetical protein C8J57DRAFT_1526275 [Mycena rebaudengoi]|nr:hypothetical protein C8J57DRAFT_1526275 [Mycena rebaudengoi]